MEPFSDNTENELHARRSARIEQMKREKQLQEQRRKMIKKYLPYGVGAAAVLILLISAIVMLVGNAKADRDKLIEAETSEVIEQTDIENTAATPADLVNAGMRVNPDTSEEALAQTAINILQNSYTPQYTFLETSDTVTIYSDEVISTNAILINESTDTIVASKGANQRINPASMTKVLTVLVAAEAITEEELDNTFTMTTEITDYAYVNDCNSVGFSDGEKVTLRDLFYGTTLHSGGDAAVGLATYVAGSHEAFVDMMNEKLKAMGIAELRRTL